MTELSRHTPEPTDEILFQLAIPARWGAYERLRSFGDLTARQIANMCHVSEASMLAHLKVLKAVGFVTVVDEARPVRQQVWQAVPGGVRLGQPDWDEPIADAVAAFLRVQYAYQTGVLEEWIDAASRWPTEWAEAAESQSYVFHLRADELDQMSTEIRALMRGWWERSRDRERESVRPVYVATCAVPYPDDDAY